MKILLNFLWISATSALLLSCTSVPPTREGLQNEFLALNPARIAAYPPLILPHPAHDTSIDPAAVVTSQIQSQIESKILAAFKNQPNVNGISFQTVRSLIKESPKLASEIDTELKTIGQLANSGSTKELLLLSKECRSQKNVLDFYKHCMIHSSKWIPLMNQFANTVQNADSVLVPILTTLEKSTEKNIYTVRVGVALVLIDTNSGKLIWGRDSIIQFDSPQGTKQFADVNSMLDKIFTEEFWHEFPGRRAKNSENN